MAFDLGAFARQYYIDPLWQHTGYNPVNTATYALIALGALYFIWREFQKRQIALDRPFWMAALSWTLWGSSVRVLTDSIDSGLMARAAAGAGTSLLDPIARAIYPLILQSHLLDYGLLTVSPGIYIVTALLFLSTFALGRAHGWPRVSMQAALALAALNYALLLPMAGHWLFALAPLLAALVVGALLWFGLRWREPEMLLPVIGQALDGAATWTAIDLFGPSVGMAYSEQHVLSGWIGTATPLGFGLFFLLKVAFAALAVHLISKEENREIRSLALLVIAIIGFAPGLRDLLRMLLGT